MIVNKLECHILKCYGSSKLDGQYLIFVDRKDVERLEKRLVHEIDNTKYEARQHCEQLSESIGNLSKAFAELNSQRMDNPNPVGMFKAMTAMFSASEEASKLVKKIKEHYNAGSENET